MTTFAIIAIIALLLVLVYLRGWKDLENDPEQEWLASLLIETAMQPGREQVVNLRIEAIRLGRTGLNARIRLTHARHLARQMVSAAQYEIVSAFHMKTVRRFWRF